MGCNEVQIAENVKNILFYYVSSEEQTKDFLERKMKAGLEKKKKNLGKENFLKWSKNISKNEKWNPRNKGAIVCF